MKRNRIGLIVLTAMLCISTAVFANWRETVDIGNLRVKTLTANPGFGNTSITVASPITLSGDLTLEADLVLETGGIIRNDAVDDFEFLGTNQTATLAELIVGTTANQSTIANNDLFNIKAVAPDSASNDTSYATIVLQITDKTTTSEDGQIVLKAMKAGSDTTIATLGYTSAGAEVGTFTVPIDCDSLTVDAGGAGIDAQSGGALAVGSTTATSLDLSKSAAMTTVKGTFNVDQAATFDTSVGVTGDLTASGNILGDGVTIVTNMAAAWVTSVEPNTATTLTIGPSYATKLELADTGIETEIQGTLDVIQGADFDSTVTVAGTIDLNGVATCTNLSLDAGSTLTVGTATIVPTSATELTISETTVTVSGTTLAAPALTATSATVSGDIAANGTITGDNDTVVTGISNVTLVAGSTLAAQAVTATSFLLNGEAGWYAADSTAMMAQTTNVTMHAGTVWTQTWATVFGAAPTTTIITPTELHTAVPFYSSNTPSNVLITVEADKDFTLTQIGAKP